MAASRLPVPLGRRRGERIFGHEIFVWAEKDVKTLHQFRKELAHQMIMNIYMKEEDKAEERDLRKRAIAHELTWAAAHARAWKRGKWDLASKAPHQQYICKSKECHNQTRYYCTCHTGYWMCKKCFAKHLISVAREG